MLYRAPCKSPSALSNGTCAYLKLCNVFVQSVLQDVRFCRHFQEGWYVFRDVVVDVDRKLLIAFLTVSYDSSSDGASENVAHAVDTSVGCCIRFSFDS